MDLETIVSQASVFNADQVETKATLDTSKGFRLDFPPSLYAAGVPGLVIAEFVVDSEGHIEDGTLGIVSSTAPLFTEAVRLALENAAYVPATKDGHRVRQFVQQPFEFSVNRQGKDR